MVDASNPADLTYISKGVIRTLCVHNEGVDLVLLRSIPLGYDLKNLGMQLSSTMSMGHMQ